VREPSQSGNHRATTLASGVGERAGSGLRLYKQCFMYIFSSIIFIYNHLNFDAKYLPYVPDPQAINFKNTILGAMHHPKFILFIIQLVRT
jgi:hypothetical protein